MTYQTILLCYDGSREGRKALLQGAELAQTMGAHVHLLAVVDLSALIGQSAGYVGETVCVHYEEAMQDVLNEGVACLRQRGLTAEGHLETGVPVDTIAACAQRLNADLVVVGHRCRQGFARWWSRSSSASLLDKLSCSLLVTCSSAAEQQALNVPPLVPPLVPAAA